MFKRVTKTNVKRIKELSVLQSIETQKKITCSEKILRLIRSI